MLKDRKSVLSGSGGDCGTEESSESSTQSSAIVGLTVEAAEERLERDSDTEEGGGLGGADTARLYDIAADILGAEVTAARPSTGRGGGPPGARQASSPGSWWW